MSDEVDAFGRRGRRTEGQQRHLTAAEQFGRAVLALCESKGWKLRELSRRAYVDVGLISRVVRGITPPSLETAKSLDRAFGSGNSLEILAIPARAEPQLHLPAPRFFLGRDAQLARLNAVTDGMTSTSPPTVIVIAGPPGVGKTSLALRWANGTKSAFDTVLWSDLRGYTGRRSDESQPESVLEDLLRGLGTPANRIPATDAERLRTLNGQLHKRGERVLIVLDNAYDLAQIKPVLPRVPGTTVLITSRRRIVGLAQEARTVHVSLAPMDEGDSTELVATLIGEERAQREPAAVARLVSLCAALPLALNIAANLVAAEPDISVQAHADALAERGRLHLLDGDDGVIGVRAAFSWSYQAASPEDARMFRLLGLFPGVKFSFGAAAALAGVPDNEAVRILDRLTQAHLAQQLDHRFYRLHDLLRAYAAEEIATPMWMEERQGAVVRLVRWYVHGANAAAWALMPARDHHVDLGDPPEGVHPPRFETTEPALKWCAAEISNVTPIAQLAFDHQLWFEAWRLPTDLIDYHVLGRPLQVWKDSTEVALRAAEAAGEDAWIAEAADKLAEACRRERAFDRAYELDRRALSLLQPLVPTHPRLGWPLIGLGNTAHARGEFHDAVDLIGRGVAAFAAGGSRIGELAARLHWGRALRSVGDRARALQEGHRALDGFQRDGDVHGVASALVPLARSYSAFGDVHRAIEYSEQAIATFRQASDPWGEADALNVKGMVLNRLGQRDDALECLTTAVRLVETIDDVKTQQLRDDIDLVTSASESP